MAETTSSPDIDHDDGAPPGSRVHVPIGRISRLEVVVGATIAAIMTLLVLVEPNILEAPFENGRTLLFTFGGTALAALALVVMLRLGIHPIARVIVLVVPFALVNWWLISPYFVDDVVDEAFSTSISEQLVTPGDDPDPEPDGSATATVTTASEPPATNHPGVDEPAAAASQSPLEEASATTQPSVIEAPRVTEAPVVTEAPGEPVLLGAGRFVGLAGHDGTGDAGIFRNPDGSLVLRFENFDIENGPDLEVYLVPGAERVSLPDGSIHLGALKGNIGDQNYDLPAGTELASGAYTVLVWCDAFSVEFVGATITV